MLSLSIHPEMDIRRRVVACKHNNQVSKLKTIIGRYNDKPTERQVNYLRALGYEDDISELTKGKVSSLIDELNQIT